MSKWKDVRTYMEVNPYTGRSKSEDAPANSVAGGGVAQMMSLAWNNI